MTIKLSNVVKKRGSLSWRIAGAGMLCIRCDESNLIVVVERNYILLWMGLTGAMSVEQLKRRTGLSVGILKKCLLKLHLKDLITIN